MKLRHYLLIAFTVTAIAFFQPLILLLGGVTLIIGVAALIYSDLTPEAQDACENKIVELLEQARSFLRRNPRGPATPRAVATRPAGSHQSASHQPASHQLLPDQSRADEIKADLNPETSAHMNGKAQDKASNRPDKRADKFYRAANPDL